MISKKLRRPAGEQILEGSRAIALTIKNIAPEVISAYPITPQTHIVEDLAKFKADGAADYEYVRAESEFAAASIILGASATGARTYSATSSQGLLLMIEVLYNISGLRLPIVMTCANRAVSAPINIWNDHSDAMAMRDAGWLQLFAENHQEAIYQHILAYKIAEKLSLPVMVNVDGFILTHSYEAVQIPPRTIIKKFLPDYQAPAGIILDPNNPITLGGFFPPDAYFASRQSLATDAAKARQEIKKEYAKLKKVLGLKSNNNGLVEYSGPRKPKNIIIAMGSVAGTIKAALLEKNDTGLLKIISFRPFPEEEIKKATAGTNNIIIIDKAVSPGNNSPLYTEVKAALAGERKNISGYIAGLGGQDITKKNILTIIDKATKRQKGSTFLA